MEGPAHRCRSRTMSTGEHRIIGGVAGKPLLLLTRSLLVLLLSFVCSRARADAIPDGVRGYTYNVSYENLAAYPQYVFYVYPTSNSGYAYRVEPNKPLNKLMVTQGRHGSPGTSLYAVKKSEFDKSVDPKESKVDHGDNGEVVQVFSPIAGAVKSNLVVSRPKPHVPFDSPQRELTRVFRVVKITEQALELELVKNEVTMRDGTKKAMPYGQELDELPKTDPALPRRDADGDEDTAAPSSAPSASASAEPPRKSGCAGCAVAGRSEMPLASMLAVLFVWSRRARRRSGAPDRRTR